MNAAKRALRHPQRAKLRAYLAASLGVTPEKLIEVVEARKRFRHARSERMRARKRVLKRKGGRYGRTDVLHAGEGRFTELLKMAGMTEREFAEWVGMHGDSVRTWYGFPLHDWPVKLLEHLLCVRAMSELLRANGWNPDLFWPKGLPRAPDGNYPRTKAAGKKIIDNISGVHDERSGR